MVYYFIMTFLVHSICGESLGKMQLPRPRGAGRDEDDEKKTEIHHYNTFKLGHPMCCDVNCEVANRGIMRS